MSREHPGRTRRVLGTILFLFGAFFSTVNIYAGDAIFYLGLGLLVWGTVIYVQQRKVARDAAAVREREERLRRPQIAAAQTHIAPNPPPSSPPPPPRPAVPATPPSSSIPRPPPRHMPDAQLPAVSNFLAQYRPSERFGREGEFEVELAQALRGRFGNQHVLRQVPVGEGRIDIQVFGVGVELKIAGSPSSLLRLTDQVAEYRDHYGPNLIVVILDDTGGNEQITNLRRFLASQGVQVLLK